MFDKIKAVFVKPSETEVTKATDVCFRLLYNITESKEKRELYFYNFSIVVTGVDSSGWTRELKKIIPACKHIIAEYKKTANLDNCLNEVKLLEVVIGQEFNKGKLPSYTSYYDLLIAIIGRYN